MDKTYLLNRSREELARAEAATSEEARLAHEALARCFQEAAEKGDISFPGNGRAELPRGASQAAMKQL